MKSKIDTYGLGEKVIQLRQRYSLAKTAEIINTYLGGKDTINATTITRWEQKRNITKEKQDSNFIYGTSLDALRILMDSYSNLKLNIEKINKKMKSCETVNDSAVLFDSFTRAVSAGNKIALDMAKLQRQLYDTGNVKRIIDAVCKMIMELDKKYPEIGLKAEFAEKLKEDKVLLKEIKKRY